MSTPTDFGDLINIFVSLLRATLPVLFGLAMLAFIWGLVKFISRVGGDEKAVTEGKSFMIWSVIALFVLVSIWGILQFFYGGFGFSRPFGLPFLP
jgi:hypothetical protein